MLGHGLHRSDHGGIIIDQSGLDETVPLICKCNTVCQQRASLGELGDEGG